MLLKTFIFLTFLVGYSISFPVLPIRFFLPHQEVDEFGAPIHHSILANDEIEEGFYNDYQDGLHTFENQWVNHDENHYYDHEHPSIHSDHAFYSHGYGIEPEVEAVEINVHEHKEPHRLAELENESLFAKTHTSHGFDSTEDYMDSIHHDHLHHNHLHQHHPEMHEHNEHGNEVYHHGDNSHHHHYQEDGWNYHHQPHLYHHDMYDDEYGHNHYLDHDYDHNNHQLPYWHDWHQDKEIEHENDLHKPIIEHHEVEHHKSTDKIKVNATNSSDQDHHPISDSTHQEIHIEPHAHAHTHAHTHAHEENDSHHQSDHNAESQHYFDHHHMF